MERAGTCERTSSYHSDCCCMTPSRCGLSTPGSWCSAPVTEHGPWWSSHSRTVPSEARYRPAEHKTKPSIPCKTQTMFQLSRSQAQHRPLHLLPVWIPESKTALGTLHVTSLVGTTWAGAGGRVTHLNTQLGLWGQHFQGLDREKNHAPDHSLGQKHQAAASPHMLQAAEMV